MTSPFAPAPVNRGGRPAIGDAIKIKFPADTLSAIDAAADLMEVSRSEWIRRACMAGINRAASYPPLKRL